MARKNNHLTKEERIAQEHPDGFVVKHYSRIVQIVVFLTLLFLSFVSSILIIRTWELHKVVVLIIFVAFLLFGYFLAYKIILATGTTVNLKITKVGLEQTKMSRSVLVPQKRIVEWDNMRYCRYPFFGMLFIKTKEGKNYRLESCPVMFWHWDYDYGSVFNDFQWEFERMAKQHGITI